MTLSHFLPRRELYNGRPDLVKVMGGPKIDSALTIVVLRPSPVGRRDGKAEQGPLDALTAGRS